MYFNQNHEIHMASILPKDKFFYQLFGQSKDKQIFTIEACSLTCQMLITVI